MKTLYININNEDLQSNDELEVLKHDLDGDFFFYLGEKIAKSCKEENEIALITDFNTQDTTEDFQKIIAQWNELKTILFSENCEGEFEFTLPKGYIHWLRYSEKYNHVYDKNFSHGESTLISIDLEDLYEESVEDMQRKILRKLQRDDLYKELDEIVFNDNAITRKSPIVRAIKDKYEGVGFKAYKKWMEESKPQEKIPDIGIPITNGEDDSNSCVNRFSPPLVELFNQDFDNFAINSEYIVRDGDSYYYTFIDNSNKAYHNVGIGSYGSPSKIINSITFLEMSTHQWILDLGITENLSFNNIQAVLRVNGFKIIHAKHVEKKCSNDIPRNILVAESADRDFLIMMEQLLDGYWQDSLTVLLDSCPICGCNKINVAIKEDCECIMKLECNKCGGKWHAF